MLAGHAAVVWLDVNAAIGGSVGFKQKVGYVKSTVSSPTAFELPCAALNPIPLRANASQIWQRCAFP